MGAFKEMNIELKQEFCKGECANCTITGCDKTYYSMFCEEIDGLIEHDKEWAEEAWTSLDHDI